MRGKRFQSVLSASKLAIVFLALTPQALAQQQTFSKVLGLPPLVTPANNPSTPQKVALGKALFFDKRLSKDGKMSCAACHQPDKAFTDNLVVAKGLNGRLGVRNTPSLLNAVYAESLFWEGRRTSLEDQAMDPFTNPIEHGMSGHTALLQVIQQSKDYRSLVKEAYGLPIKKLGTPHVANALANFQRTLVSGNSAFDRYQYGQDKSALSHSARQGLDIFQNQAKCASCHTIGGDSALFTDNKFHRLGIGNKKIESRLAELTNEFVNNSNQTIDQAFLTRPELAELGRFLVTKNPNDIGRFKTPSLRNVALTAPYMHDGSIATLEEAVELEIYYRGIEANRPIVLMPQEKADLIEFLKSLTGSEAKKF